MGKPRPVPSNVIFPTSRSGIDTQSLFLFLKAIAPCQGGTSGRRLGILVGDRGATKMFTENLLDLSSLSLFPPADLR
jgi:hypothetical protein